MKWATIGDIFKIASGGTPQSSKIEYYENGNIPWVNTGDLKSRHLTINKITKKITKHGLENSSTKIFPVNTVLVALYGASIGNCSILKTEAATNQACAALLPNNEQSEEFLYFYMLSIQQQLINKGQGGGQPNISAEILKRIKYPLLPLETQYQIVTVLDKAQGIIDKRKACLELLDQLLKDTFLDMFGDPVSNPFKWESGQIKDFIEDGLQNGLYVHATQYGKGTKILRIDSFYDGDITNINELQKVDIDKSTIQLYSLKENDIIINRVNSRKFLGKSAIIPFIKEEMVFESNMMRFRVNLNKINPHFLINFLQLDFIKNQILNRAKDAANQSSINQEDVKSLKILIPHLDIQERFSLISQEIKKIIKKIEIERVNSEALFKSLLQEAFSEKGLEIQQEAATNEIAATIMSKLKEEVEALPKNKTVKGFVDRIDKYLQNLPALAGSVKPSASKEISTIVQKLVPSANNMLNFLVEKGVHGFANIQNRLQAEEITSLPFFRMNNETKQLAKLLLDKVDYEQKKKEQEEAEVKINDPILQYVDDTKIGNIIFGNYRINIVELVKEYFPETRFSIGNLIEKLLEDKAITTQHDTLEKGVFEAIDNFILTELWEMPFTFPQLEDGLRNLQFLQTSINTS